MDDSVACSPVQTKFRRLYSKIVNHERKIVRLKHRKDNQARQLVPEEGAGSFMKLPVEVRLLIYSYLVLDKEITSIWESQFFSRVEEDPLRYDSTSYSTALLRTNRKICYELIEQWYKLTRYFYKSKSGLLLFETQPLPIALDLPYGFRFLRKIELDVGSI